MAEAKERRAALRASGQSLSAQQQEQMVRESQYQKAELRRIKKRWDETLAEPRRQKAELDNRIATLRQNARRNLTVCSNGSSTNIPCSTPVANAAT